MLRKKFVSDLGGLGVMTRSTRVLEQKQSTAPVLSPAVPSQGF